MENKVRIQDDLYEYVNGEWIANAVIPDDRPTIGGFSTLDKELEELMMSEFRAFASGEKTTDIREFEDAIKLYRKVMDVERRNREGIQPILPLLHEIAAIDSAEKLNEKAVEFVMKQVMLPFECDVEVDMSDTTKYCFMIKGPSTILPDTTYYGTEPGNQLLGVYSTMAANALKFTDLGEEEQKKYLEDTLAFDGLVAQKVKSQVEWADYVSMYNPFTVEETAEYLKPMDFKGMLHAVWKDDIPDKIIVADPKAIKEMNFYFNEENISMYAHWAYVKTLLSKSQFLSEELASNSTIYRRTLIGVPNDPEMEKQAYQIVGALYAEPIGVYYGRTYFGEEAKKDVVNMVKKIIATYMDRVRNNDFLRQETKDKAILKLSTIKIKMGYPDSIREIFSRMHVNEEDSYYDAVEKVIAILLEDSIGKLHKTVDRGEWLMPGHMVNACYDPSRNDITFPAAILQKPFYSINQSASENLGGIGTVIAHEISHAFDNNGSHFDENGNLANWWQEEDFAAVQKLTQKMIEQWDGIPFGGDKVNGELVVSENIADNGGVAVALQIMHETEGADFQKFFINFARIWCMKANPEYIQLLLKNDVHSPCKLRANIQVRNFPEWYEAFGVTEKDQMYIAPEKRIIIW